jgi:hypothetical protein
VSSGKGTVASSSAVNVKPKDFSSSKDVKPNSGSSRS